MMAMMTLRKETKITLKDEETKADKTITYMKTIYKKLQLKFIEVDDT